MAKLQIVAGTTSKLLDLFIQDSSSTVGAGLTGLVFNTGSLTAYYYREGAASATAITLATMTLGTWATGGFVVVDGTNMPGCYQISIPNAAIAAGAKSCIVMLKGAANMAPLVLEIELTAVDNQDGVHFGLTALPNTAVTTNASLLTSGTGTDQLSVASGRVDAGKILGTAISTPATAGILDVNVKNIDNDAASASGTVTFPNATLASTTNITAGTIATVTAVTTVNGLAAGVITAASIAADAITAAKVADGTIDAATFAAGAINAAAIAADAITDAKVASDVTIASVTGAVGSVTGAVGSVTGNVGGNVVGTVASVVGAVGSVTGNVGGNVTGTIGQLAAQAKADVNAEVVDALSVDTYAEPGQETPAATASIAKKIGYLFKVWRNKATNDGTTIKIYNDGGSVVDQTSVVSETAGTVTRGQHATGP